MAKSGLDQLLDVLKQSGFDIPGQQSKGAASAESGEGAGASEEGAGNGGASRGGFGGFGGANGGGSAGGRGGFRTPDLNISFATPNSKGGKIAFAIAIILILAAAYWWFHPAINIHSEGVWMVILIFVALPLWLFFRSKQRLYKNGGEGVEKSPKTAKKYKNLLIIPIAIVVLYLLGSLLSLSIIPGNAGRYASILKTDTLEFSQDIEEVNYSQIPVIDKDSAILLGNREMGTISEYVSQFEIDDLYSQINYQGKPVRVSPLNYADLFKWFTNRTNGIPAYSIVDMTTQDAEIVRLGDEAIFYSQSEPLARNIDRYVQLKYPFYIFDEKSFEIDEDGHPWWICPVRTYTIGLFGGYTIERVVLCDATTGETQDLDIADVPEWVDRAYPSEVLLQQYNWYGAYHNGWLNSFLGQEGVVMTTPGSDGYVGYNYIAKDDDVWVYSGVTSATSDESIIGFVLINQRTAESHFYSISGATETSAMDSAEGQVQNLRYSATFPILINVADQPTYFMALKDSAGLVKKYAMIDIRRYQNVAVGDTVAQTQSSYEQLLATNGIVSEDDLSSVQTTQASGTISLFTQVVLDGNTHYYVMLEGDEKLYDFPVASLTEIVKYKEGDVITFDYADSETGLYAAYAIK